MAPRLVYTLAAVGAFMLAPQAVRLLRFVWLYVLRPSTVHRYLHGGRAYALVTGATDGIGRAVAQELYSRGFDLVIHGRNEEKVRAVAAEIAAGRAGGDVRCFVADAAQPGHDFAGMVAPFGALHITLVVHNVGGSPLVDKKIDDWSEAEVAGFVHWNAVFPLLLTRALLPQLRRAAQAGPVMVQFVGSHVGDHAPPRLPVYAGTKAFLGALARGLDTDERAWGPASGVRCAYLVVGSVRTRTNAAARGESLAVPGPERFARALVARVGCGRRRYAPYLPHAVVQWAMGALGESWVDWIAARVIRQAVQAEGKRD
ncbi:NAD(P)-binding protein [Wolfiporia cocos MD-104 SS10]|uniref:NAD(P)-binding protein n=1 Tax=Wolfiporia cocos (strain MD-104) TaxID=742152 RepID=A0A2H3J796_WOLCO|nr:NAD(P)-binding protein [Wolfiporia cocos MD-104 SS10]